MEGIAQDFYLDILRAMPIACVDVAILSRDACLFVRRLKAPARGAWWLPGGRVHNGETLRVAAARKARGEVGLACAVGPIVFTGETLFEDGPSDVAVHSVNVCFLLHPIGLNTVLLDEDHTAFAWVRTIPADLDPYVTECLRNAGLV